MTVYFEVWAKDTDDTEVILQSKMAAPNVADEPMTEEFANTMATMLKNRGATDVSVKRVEE